MDKDDQLIYEGWRNIAAAGVIGATLACSPSDPDCKPEEQPTFKDLKLDNVVRQQGRYVFGSDGKGEYVAYVSPMYNPTDTDFDREMDKASRFRLEAIGIRLLHADNDEVYNSAGMRILKAYIDKDPNF